MEDSVSVGGPLSTGCGGTPLAGLGQDSRRTVADALALLLSVTVSVMLSNTFSVGGQL